MSSLNNSCQDIKIQYSLVKHLKLHSESDDKYKSLYASWIIDEKVYTNALTAVANSFPHYSMHDSSHSLSIINKIEMILGEKRIKQLSPTDTFLILETAFVHDLGMIISEDDQKKLWAELEFKKYIEDILNNNYDQDLVTAAKYIQNIQENGVGENSDWPLEVKKFVIILNADYFRRVHNYRSSDVIMNSNQIDVLSSRNNLIQERIMRLVAQIAIMHGTNFGDILEKMHKEDIGMGTDEIHPRMIACLLRLGDLLDLDNGRFNEILVRTIFMPETSKDHKEKHQAITHFFVSPERIEVSAICPDDRVYRATRQWFDWLQDELKNLSSKWSDIVPYDFIGGPPSLGDIKLSIKDDDKGITEQLNFKFNIDQKVAFEFIEGEGIYTNKLDCIREVIQNALDATKIQMWRDIKLKKYDVLRASYEISKKELNFSSDIPEIIRQLYPISISVDEIKDKEESVFEVCIQDSGCGINLLDLKRMESVGNSWSNNIDKYREIEKMNDWFKPTGSFGIGLHSLFMITDEVKIETKSEKGDAYDITFISSKNNGYISIKVVNEERTVGTKVKFKFKSDIVENVDSNSLNPDIRLSLNISRSKYDIVELDYKHKMNKQKICCILNSYINSINWVHIIKKGELEKYKEVKKDYFSVYEKELKEKDDLKIAVDIDKNSQQLVALVYDMSNYSQIYFSLINMRDNISEYYESFLLEAFGLGRFANIWDGATIYYKDIFCTNRSFRQFNLRINIVNGKAKKLLSVNRNGFRNNKFIYKYIERIDIYIKSKVIYEMWNYVYNNDTKCFKIDGIDNTVSALLAGFYYKNYFDKDLDLNIFKNNIEFNKKTKCIKKITKNKDWENASISDIVNADKVLITRDYNDISKGIANKNKIDIIVSNCYYTSIKEVGEKIGLLTFNKLEHIGLRNIIAYRERDKTDSQIIVLDYEKTEIVKDFIEKLFTQNDSENAYRSRIDAFEYINKKNMEKSKIKYLITNNYEIISPFISGMDSNIFGKDIFEVIKELKERYKFNELIDYVYKNSLHKKLLSDNNYKDKIEDAYQELINDYINFAVKKDRDSIIEKEVASDEEKKEVENESE